MSNTTILKQEISRGYVGHALDYDAAGKGFLAIAVADPANPNIVRVPVYMAERGQPFSNTPIGTAEPQLKIDSIDLDHSGTTLIVSMTTHAPQEAPRPTAVEAYTIQGVWATSAAFEAERGGVGGFTGNEGEPEPGGGGVTEEQLRTILRDELGLRDGENDLITQFAGAAPTGQSTIRKGLHETGVGDTKKGEIELLTGTDDQALHYQDASFQFIKNANAGVQHNILFGEDAWGAMHRAAMVAIVAEGSRMTPEAADAKLQEAVATFEKEQAEATKSATPKE